MRRVFVLLAHDPATGCATAPVAVVGVEPDGASFVSWLPHQELGQGWRATMAATTAPLAEALEVWLGGADGVAADVVELEAPASPNLRGSVEAVIDHVMAMGGG